MKRKTVTNAVLAGLTGVAGMTGISNAVNINPDGLGEALVYPFFTVNGGNQTLVSIVNTTDQGKAVKVRFLEAMNSREVLDFNLYLSPFDVWVGAVFDGSPEDSTDPPVLITGDNSCTVPPIPAEGVPFRNFAYAGGAADGETDSLERSRQGHLEMLEMGEVTNTDQGSLNAITHGTTGIPANCTQVVNAWVNDPDPGDPDGYWIVDATQDMQPAAGGLFGGASIVDTVEGTQVSANADAVDGYSDDILHAPPGSTDPSFADTNTGGLLTPTIDTFVFNNAAVVSSTWAEGATGQGRIDAVSAVYMHDAIYNEYSLEPLLNAGTEWVVTFPTKRFYVVDTTANNNDAIAPFTEEFGLGGACEEFNFFFRDREEGPVIDNVGGIDFSPSPVVGSVFPLFQMCWEANVVRFANDNQTADAALIFGAPEGGTGELNGPGSVISGVPNNGWGAFDFTCDNAQAVLGGATCSTRILSATSGEDYTGLPVTGFAASIFKNDNADPGVKAQYGGTSKHRASRVIN